MSKMFVFCYRCQLSSFPKISVARHNSEWFTSDNRRLWVFRHLYRLGKCGEIPVIVVSAISPSKMTTETEGRSINVRGDPGGIWHLMPSGSGSNRDGSYNCTWPDSDALTLLQQYLDNLCIYFYEFSRLRAIDNSHQETSHHFYTILSWNLEPSL